MKIKELKKNKNGTYKIILDNDEVITTYDDVILNHGLLYHKEIDSKLLNEINKESKYYEIYNKTLKFIERKLRSRKEIELFLTKNDVSDKNQKKILQKLESINLINDEVFANAYLQDRLNLSSDGPYKIINELKKNNISDEIIALVQEKVDNDFIYEKLTKLIIKKIKSNHNKSNYMLKQKIIIDMINLGYDKSMIVDILEENMNSNNSIINNEYRKIYNKLSRKYSGEELDKMVINKLIQKGFRKEEIDKIEK